MKNILFFLLLTLSISVFSQKTISVIYLKNGGELRGDIIEDTDAKIRIKSSSGNVFVAVRTEIIRIETEEVFEETLAFQEKGYFSILSMGVLIGSQENSHVAPFSAFTSHHYKFNKWLAAGGALGIEFLNETLLPLTANVNFFIPNKQNNLYFGASSGYSFSTETPDNFGVESASGGFLYNLECGIILVGSQNYSFFTGIGYRYNELNYKYNNNWMGEVNRKVSYNRFSIRFGLVFH